MDALILFAGAVVLGVQIWLIVLFVRLSRNVAAILSLLSSRPAAPAPAAVTLRDARLAVLLNRQSECYDRVVAQLYAALDTAALEQTLHRPPTVDPSTAISSAASVCSVLGRSLPEQLASFDAFKSFCQ